MPYDPNDPDTKKAVQAAIAAALEEQEQQHEVAITGLKTKNKELLANLKKANEGKDSADPVEIARLEGELETVQKALKEANKQLKVTQATLEETTGKLTAEEKAVQRLVVDGGLTEALAKANVAAPFLPAAKALLSSKVEVKEVAGERKAFVGDLALGDYVTQWSQGDEGKHYIAAPVNGGGGANGGRAPEGGSGKATMTRAAFEEQTRTNPAANAKFFADGGTLVD